MIGNVIVPDVCWIELGSRVLIGGDIPGIVTGILQRLHGSSEIEVVWWDGRIRKCEWVNPQELKPNP